MRFKVRVYDVVVKEQEKFLKTPLARENRNPQPIVVSILHGKQIIATSETQIESWIEFDFDVNQLPPVINNFSKISNLKGISTQNSCYYKQ